MTDPIDLHITSEGGVEQADLYKLHAATPTGEIKWRADRATYAHKESCPGRGCTQTRNSEAHVQLAYVDARYVMQRLDDDISPPFWQRQHSIGADGRISCSIGILVKGIGWVWKSDGAGETDIEGEKGAFSDAFKRAAVSWGIARDLYSIDKSSAPPRPVAAAPLPTPAQAATGNIAEGAEAIICPFHGRELRNGRYGPYCTGQGGNGPLNDKGYCKWKPAQAA
jgi:hypothetical protein